MEIRAAIEGLSALRKPCVVTLYSDSKYLVNGMSKGWAARWRAMGWQRKHREAVPNADLWQKLLELCDVHDVRFAWVRGHAGDRENERCDSLAAQALKSSSLPVDEGYEQQSARKRQPDQENAAPKKSELAFANVVAEGHPCRKCATPLVKRAPKRTRRARQAYYYEYYLYCPGCKSMFMVEDAKRPYEPDVE